MQSYLTSKLLECIGKIGSVPSKVLQIGCEGEPLENLFRERFPNLSWKRVSLSSGVQGVSTNSAEHSLVMDFEGNGLESLRLDAASRPFELILIDDTYCHIRDPRKLLSLLNELMTDSGSLLAYLPNSQHYSRVQSVLSGNWNPAQSNTKHGVTFPELVKIFLDAGWLPDLLEGSWNDVIDIPIGQALVNAAGTLGISEELARLQLGRSDFWVHAVKSNQRTEVSTPTVPLSIIVPANRDWQLECNLLASPGLKEIDVEIIVVRGASSAADAFRQGASQAKHAWRLLIHQDVYIPVGSGKRIVQQLARFSMPGQRVFAAGFLGLEAVPGIEPIACRYLGCVIDRTRRYHYQENPTAISLDEFAVAMHQANPCQIDPNLGWHLWATDLCLQTKLGYPNLSIPVMNIPIFHNTVGQYTVPNEFFMSGAYLLDKYSSLNDVPTVCGNLIRDATGNKRFEEPVRLHGG
jgi:hypothetical protein